MVGTVTSSGPGRPVRLVLALGVVAGVTALEVAGLVGFVLVIVLRATRGDRSSALNVALVCAALLVWAGGLALAARGLLAGRRWSRSPLVVSELLLLAVSVSLVQGGVRWLGWPLLVGSAAAVAAVFTPAVVGLLGDAGP
jgi:hypothetical protein